MNNSSLFTQLSRDSDTDVATTGQTLMAHEEETVTYCTCCQLLSPFGANNTPLGENL